MHGCQKWQPKHFGRFKPPLHLLFPTLMIYVISHDGSLREYHKKTKYQSLNSLWLAEGSVTVPYVAQYQLSLLYNQ